jgi:hypothetical protein
MIPRPRHLCLHEDTTPGLWGHIPSTVWVMHWGTDGLVVDVNQNRGRLTMCHLARLGLGDVVWTALGMYGG